MMKSKFILKQYLVFRAIIAKTFLRRVVVLFRHRNIHKEDVMLASYPRSGNSWVKFILANALTGINVTYDGVSDYVSYTGLNYTESPKLINGFGRLIKTHEPFRREYKKAVYIVRDPRDVIVSEYSFLKSRELFHGNMDSFIGSFLNHRVSGFGSWEYNVSSWLNSPISMKGDLLLVKYEDMQKDILNEVKRILKFIGVNVSELRIREAIGNNTFSNMLLKEKSSSDLSRKAFGGKIQDVREGDGRHSWKDVLNKKQSDNIKSKLGKIMAVLGYD